MSGNIEIANTSEARNCCQTIDAGIAYYENLVTELTNAKDKMQANWEGDSAALSDVITKIESTIGLLNTTITAAKLLSKNVVTFANEIDKVADNTVDNNTHQPTPDNGMGGDAIVDGTVSGVGNQGDGSAPTTGETTAPVEEEVGFWEYHGDNFADAWTNQDWAGAWDYSNVDGVFSAVGTTVDAILDTAGNVVDAVVDTVGAAVNFVFDGAANLVGWLFD